MFVTPALSRLYYVPMQVPKMLGVLRGSWAPEAYVISFKLETDESILVDKARQLSVEGLGASQHVCRFCLRICQGMTMSMCYLARTLMVLPRLTQRCSVCACSYLQTIAASSG